MTRFVSWLLLLLLFGVFALITYWVLQARVEAGLDMPRYSIYSEGPDGLAEAVRLLRKLGWDPKEWTRPIQQLRMGTSEPRLLIMVEPQPGSRLLGEEGIDKTGARNVVRWVEEGNTLLLCGRHPGALHQELGVALTTNLQAAREHEAREVVLGEAGAYTDGIDQLRVEGRDEVDAANSLPLWSLDGRPNAVLLRRGKGRVLVIADPSILTRRGMVQQRVGGAQFLLNVVRLHAGPNRRVYFDEFHHGLRSGSGFWAYLNYHRKHWALLPVLLTVALAVWSMGVRLGPAVSPPQPSQTDAVDYASSLARIYERAGVRHLLAESLTRDFVTALTHHLGLRRSAQPPEILAALGKRQEGAAAETAVQRLEGLLRAVADLRKGAVPAHELLFWTQEFDRFIKEHSGALRPTARRQA
jgi:hypothetical protein